MRQRPLTPRSAIVVANRFRIQRAIGIARRVLRRVVDGSWRHGAGAMRMPQPERATACSGATPRALVVDAHLPRPTMDSGSVRMVALLGILADLGLPAAFIPDDFSPEALPAAAIDTGARGISDTIRWLNRHREDIRVVILSRHTVATHWLPLIRDLLPGVPVIFDTVDLHFQREGRLARRSGSVMRQHLARMTHRDEIGLLRATDATWVVSHTEETLLRGLSPSSRIDLVSNIVEPVTHGLAFEERSDFLFLGNYRHSPNVDAVEWLADFWGALREKCGDVRLKIVGAGLPASLRARLESIEGMVVMGHVPDLETVLVKSRVMLAPLRYGAGVKGKINAAFAAGLPVVATGCAIEGMQFGSDPVALVADDADAFVTRAALLYFDADKWHAVRDAGLHCVRNHFSLAVARRAVEASLQALGVDAAPQR